jgi:hypothetical protein
VQLKRLRNGQRSQGVVLLLQVLTL